MQKFLKTFIFVLAASLYHAPVYSVDSCPSLFGPPIVEVVKKDFKKGPNGREDLVEYRYTVGGKVFTGVFSSTRRGYAWGSYPERYTNLEFLRGKKILDVATGKGQFVLDLLANKIDIVGIDGHLVPELKSSSSVIQSIRYGCYDCDLSHLDYSKEYFFERSFTDTGFPDKTFDLLFASVVFHYPMPSEVVEAAFYEMARVTKPGGLILISYILSSYIPIIEKIRTLFPDIEFYYNNVRRGPY